MVYVPAFFTSVGSIVDFQSFASNGTVSPRMDIERLMAELATVERSSPVYFRSCGTEIISSVSVSTICVPSLFSMNVPLPLKVEFSLICISPLLVSS